MSIPDNYVPVKQIGNGVTTQFSGSWAVLVSSYIRVYLEDIITGVQVAQVLGVDFSLTFNDSGFTVTFLIVAPPNTKYVVIGRNVAQDQTNPYKTSKGYQGKVLEDSLDKLTAMTQDLSDAVQRTPQFPLGSNVTGVQFPLPDAGKALIWDPTATTFVNSDDDVNGILSGAITARDTAVAAASAASTSAGNAATSEANAAASAATLYGTSNSSVLIGAGTKVFTTQSGKNFNGQAVFVSSSANPLNYVHGIASYSGTTLTVTVAAGDFGGTGTFASWNIAVSGTQGTQGIQGVPGPTGSGSGDVNGPGVSVDSHIVIFSGTSGKTIKESGILVGTMAGQNSNGVSITGGTIAGITDIAIADGGTGASTDAAARVNLHLDHLVNVDNTDAGNLVSGTVDPARLGTGTHDATTVLYGDSTYKTAPGVPTTYEAVQTYAILQNNSGSAVLGGNTLTGAQIGRTKISSAGAVQAGTGSPIGTWRNMSNQLASSEFGLFLRIS